MFNEIDHIITCYGWFLGDGYLIWIQPVMKFPLNIFLNQIQSAKLIAINISYAGNSTTVTNDG
jgi:hypothetical protein